MERITEQPSKHRHLDKMTTRQLIEGINAEDRTVAESVAAAMDQIEALVDATQKALDAGGRLFYIGAGTSGRLGVVDASECPPTFGVPHELVVGIIAGGDSAIRKAVEFAEDSAGLSWKDLTAHGAKAGDIVVGLAASGTTPYVIGGLVEARKNGLATGCIVCNPGSPVAEHSDFPVEVVVGPEFVTGSTRMKSGTAQKLVLNMLTTSVMIKLGRVVDNRMVDMALSNVKLWARGSQMLQEKHGISDDRARQLLENHGSVRAASEAFTNEK
ncbi:MAG: N-acetylmuramic acid 6-phosphate etherase [Saprospiraceae bacterium]